MSASLIAVFIPILFFPTIIGRLLREFAVTLSVAIIVSLFVFFTATPMLCAHFLRIDPNRRHGLAYRLAENIFNALVRVYDRSLRVVLRHQFAILLLTIGTVILTGYLYYAAPMSLFPQQDTGRVNGYIQGDQDISFAAMSDKLKQFNAIVMADPAVDNITAFTGGGNGTSTSRMFAQLKPLEQRKISADRVIARLRGKTAGIPGAQLFLQAVQDLSIGGRFGGAQYQYTLQAESVAELNHCVPVLMQRFQKIPGVYDVNTDQQVRGLQSSLVIDRDTASRLGVNMTDVDNTLGDAFGQRQVSNIYKGLNQYHVVLEVSENYTQGPEALNHIYVPSSTGKVIPLSSFAHYDPSNTSLSVNHQGLYPSITLSFNIAPGIALSTAVGEIEAAQRELHVPPTVHGGFQGTAQAFKESIANYLILLTALARHIVLEFSTKLHPYITIHDSFRRHQRAIALRLTGTEPRSPSLNHSSHRHRQEERHPHDRLRRPGRNAGREVPGSRHLPSLPAPLPSNSNDHHGRALRRSPAGSWPRCRLRTPPPPRYHSRRGAAREPAPDPLHHSLSFTSISIVSSPAFATPPSRAAPDTQFPSTPTNLGPIHGFLPRVSAAL
jgi:multidrug efflux pump